MTAFIFAHRFNFISIQVVTFKITDKHFFINRLE